MVTFSTVVNSKIGDLGRVRALVASLEKACGLPENIVFDINVVLDELISNIIKYAYDDDAAHDIRVKLAADDAVIEINIEDDGKAFDPFAAPEPDLSLPLAQRPIGGLGLHFVRKLMNEIKYQRVNNRNLLFLNRKIVK